MTEQTHVDAKALGRAAFKSVKDAIPIRDPALMEMVKDKTLASGEPILRAWMIGWNETKIEAQSV